MSEAKHTPWRLTASGLGVNGGPPMPNEGWPNGYRVADTSRFLPLAERQANARLIAAAPELLGVSDEALAFVEHTLEIFGWGNFPHLRDEVERLKERLKSVIAEANGGAS